MFRQYLIQALNLMKQNRFFSFVYILGTALAISMVMMMAIVYYIRTADIAPEVNRGRLCLLDAATSVSKDGQSNWTGNLSFKTIREVYYPLRTPELVSAYIRPGIFTYNVGEMQLRIPGGKDKFEINLSATDAAYWQMFRFTFIDGKPYTPADFESGLRRIVLSETRARQLFGKPDVAGQGVLLNDVEYTVAGVVRDISAVNTITCADAWVPFTLYPELMISDGAEGVLGMLELCIRCRSIDDLSVLRKEIDQNRKRYNTTLKDWEYIANERGDVRTWRTFILSELDWRTSPSKQLMQYGLLLCIFLLVPALNLSGLSSSDMVKRIPELGLRKAFGASRATLIVQVLTENFLYTFLGGIVGLLFSFLLVFLLRNLLFGIEQMTGEVSLSPGMLLNLPVFFITFGFCLLLNLLSALLPAWLSTRVSIVKAINDK